MIAKLRSLSPRERNILGVIALIIFSVIALLTSPAKSYTTQFTGALETPTITVTHQIEKIPLKREFDFHGVHLSVHDVTLAEKFSDDRKRAGKYTLRITAEAENKGQETVGVHYNELVFLILPDGSEVRTKLISIRPATLPGQVAGGFFDFPLDQPISLDQLAVRFDDGSPNGIVIPFKEAK